MDILADRLELVRLGKGLKQKDIAKMVGITPQSYNKYLSRESIPTLPVLISICDVLNISIDWVLGRENYVGKFMALSSFRNSESIPLMENIFYENHEVYGELIMMVSKMKFNEFQSDCDLAVILNNDLKPYNKNDVLYINTKDKEHHDNQMYLMYRGNKVEVVSSIEYSKLSSQKQANEVIGRITGKYNAFNK